LIEAASDSWQNTSEYKKTLREFLNDPNVQLFSSAPKRMNLSEAEVNRVYSQSGGGGYTLKIVQAMAETGENFTGIGTLIKGIKGKVAELQSYLSSKECQLLNNKGFVNQEEMFALIDASGGDVKVAISVCKELNESRFDDLAG